MSQDWDGVDATLTEIARRQKPDKDIEFIELYTKYLEPLRHSAIRLLEIGVDYGGSIRMWDEYFGPQGRIFAIDIDKRVEKYMPEGTKLFLGNQLDGKFLSDVGVQAGPFDIIIDDGGHRSDHQITSFKTLWPFLKKGGLYIIEDLQFAWKGPPPKREPTLNVMGFLHVLACETAKSVEGNTYGIHGVHFYNHIAFVEKSK